MKRKLALVLVLMTAAQTAACGGTPTDTPDTTDSQSAAAPGADYDFGSLDMGGEEFRFLNWPEHISNFYNIIDVETLDGDILNDAVWTRNSTVEEMYKVDIVEENTVDVNELVRTAVMADEDIYDVAYCRTDTLGTLALEGMFYNLADGTGFCLEEPWWDHAIIDDARIGENDALYFLSSDLNLYAFEGTWCMYFNKRMCEDLKLDLPYDTVVAGDWTLDKLYTYISAGANLNGDESWTWNKEGESVYGFASMRDFVMQMFTACGEKPIEIKDGTPLLKAGSERFFQTAGKLAKIFGEAGTAYFANDRASGNHYELIYGARRAFFTACEIKGGDGGGVYSEMLDDYGIVPLPKLDESQEDYISPSALWGYFMTVPKTNPDLDSTSVILDAMSYLSYRDIVPDYYEVVLQTKHIRDEETKDMLDIIRSTRTYMTCYAFGWGNTMRNELTNMVLAGSDAAASIIDAHKSAVEEEMALALETYRENQQ